MEDRINKIFAIAVDKGGTGKTTTVLNMAAGLAHKGYKILAVDCDQQANLTESLLGRPADYSLNSAMLNEDTALPIVHVRDDLDLAPAGGDMFGIGMALIRQSLCGKSKTDCRGKLKLLLQPLRREYDFILLDCPPSDNIMLFNALWAADAVVIVSRPEPYCIQGARKFCDIIRATWRSNPHLGLAGILITNFETGSPGHLQAEKAIRDAAPRHVFKTHIRHSRPLYNSQMSHQDIFSYAPTSIGAEDYDAFIEEFLNRYNNHE